MKKILILTSFIFGIAYVTYAQSPVRIGGGGGGLAYNEGDKIIQVGLGLGRTIGGRYGYAYSGLGAAINGAVEIGIHEYFSVGPYVAFGRYSYNFNYGLGRNTYSTTAVAAGARGSFHYTSLFNEAFDTSIDEEKLDLYVALLLGVQYNSYSYSGEGARGSSVFLDGGAVLGGRYKFTPGIAAFTELGYASLSVWTVGVSFHL